MIPPTCTSGHTWGPLDLTTDQSSPEVCSVELNEEGMQVRVGVKGLPLRVHGAHGGQGFASYRSPFMRT